MKKYLWLIVVILTLVAVPLSSLAQDALPYGLTAGKPFDGTTINFLICCPTAGQFASWAKRTEEIFTPMTGISVVYANEPWGSFQERIVTESIAGDGAHDVVLWEDVWGPPFIETLEPLDSFIERDGIDYVSDYPKGFILPGYNKAGELVAFPVRSHPFVLYYRMDIFEELGLSVPTTWTELIAAGKTIKEKKGIAGIANIFGVSTAQNLFVWSMMLKGMGLDIFDDTYHPAFNSDAGLEATDLYMQLRELGQESQFTDDEGGASTALAQGTAAMFVNWWWHYEEYINPEIAVEGVVGNVGVAPVPAIDGKDPANYVLAHLISMSGSSQNKDAAWEFMKFLSSPQLDREVALDKSDPATNNVVISHTSLFTDPEYNAANANLGMMALPGLDNAAHLPLITDWAEVSAILETAINDIALGAEAKATLDDAAAQVEEVMQRAGYYD